ncbi:hypothetical protein LSUE1_G003677 [Lachnellula suecica]|uniref:Extracellular serine-rich protein n=1 Tax=Lachnellula suecica TaxID=602035 RepID=A0A8T9CH91_9HELO|nr:hypothetical protein LSUE1_G003677 [Lachnellula suecica]
MLSKFLFQSVLYAASISLISASTTASESAESESLVVPSATRQAAPVVPTVAAHIDNKVVNSNTSTINNDAVAEPAGAVTATSVSSTVLIFARDLASSYSAYSGLNGYDIPYQVVLVPQTGTTLPTLNSSSISGNYGAIVILSEVSYDYGNVTGFQSALTAAQLATLYQYQISFGVRMVRLDVFPSADSGTTTIGGCCDSGVEQLVSISSTAEFPTSGLKTGAGMSTVGIYHYPATITNSTIATEFAQFAPTTGFSTTTTAGVINNISGRQQMVFFSSFATDWAATSNFLQHAWIHWATRGLYTGYRRVNLNTQIDDMFLESDVYSPNGTTFLISPADLAEHVSWIPTINAKMPSGSNWFPETGHNGNGNIEDSEDVESGNQCSPGSVEYGDQIDTPLEFMKPLGTGTSIWPADYITYPNFTTSCTSLDPLLKWWQVESNLNSFAHVSHTFTHEDQDNATYADVSREISWNAAWLEQVGIATATKYSSTGIIPPAITGLHNGDALRAWSDNGIIHVVGDNTRPVLMNSQNEMWPLISTVAGNGFAGIQINPRWATNIYYNCPLPACTVLEWINTSAGAGDFYDLLAVEKAANTRHLLGLHHDPYMFHQANLNYETAGETTINGVSAKLSMFQAWMETIVQEMARLTEWPMISQKHDDMSAGFASRMARDACNASLTYTTNPTAGTITGVTLTTTDNTCSVAVPVTVPGTVTSTQGFTTEQIGSDPLTIWVNMTGSPVSFTLSTPVHF